MPIIEMAEYVSEINDYLKREDYDGLDLWVKDDLYQLESIYLLTFLKTVCPKKDKLSMYDVIKEQLKWRYTEKEMQGL